MATELYASPAVVAEFARLLGLGLNPTGSSNAGLNSSLNYPANTLTGVSGTGTGNGLFTGHSRQPAHSSGYSTNQLLDSFDASAVNLPSTTPATASDALPLLPLPAAFAVYSADGSRVPGLLTDGLGNFWQVVDDGETPDDPANVKEVEEAADEDEFGLLGCGAGHDHSYPSIDATDAYPKVDSYLSVDRVAVDSYAIDSATAYAASLPSARSASPSATTAYSPRSSNLDPASPASYAEIDWEFYDDKRTSSVAPSKVYPALNTASDKLSFSNPQNITVNMSTISSPSPFSLPNPITPAFYNPLTSTVHHPHSHPVSQITHPTLSPPAPRATPRDDVSYPCPIPGCPASFRCASRGVLYAPGRMVLLYTDSVPVDRMQVVLNGEGGEGEVVSDRDCEFVRHLFGEHEGELSCRTTNPKTSRPEKTWLCPLCPYTSKKCNVEAHMLSAGSGHHPAKHLFCTSCSNEGRTVWLYNYQSAVNHFEERHGVKVGKRGPGRRKEVVKGRGKRERGVAWEAPVADEVQEEEQGQQEGAPKPPPTARRPEIPAAHELQLSATPTVPDSLAVNNLVPAGNGYYLSPEWMIAEDGRGVRVGKKEDKEEGVQALADKVGGLAVDDGEATTEFADPLSPSYTASAAGIDVDAAAFDGIPALIPALSAAQLGKLKAAIVALLARIEAHEKAVKNLVEMGFSTDEAGEALKKAGGKLEGAVEVLLGGGSS